ncbi:hypothetical protein AcW1_004123 [Taiwanofungus camphoratus]|nr:hypothetical protein AcW1_004123 [Antrodia cinnamomea]
MEYTNAAAWLQSQPIPDLQAVGHDGQHPANDDWKEPVAGAQAGAGSAPAPPPSMDLNGFGLGDISVPTSSASPVSNPSPAFFTFPQHSFYLSSAPGPYNAVAYGAPQWSNPGSQLPLSSYSSLNGATSTSSPSNQQSQPAPAPTMMIDPALTTMNGSGSPSMQQYQHSPPFLSSQPQQRPQFPYQHQQHQPTLSINPSFVHASASHYSHSPIPRPPSQQQQQQQQQQGTLSPYVLHSPPNATTLTSPLPPSAFYAPMSMQHPPTPTPEQRRLTFLTAIKPHLTPTSFTGAGAVAELVSLIEDYGTADVDPQTRLEILTKMRDNAGNHYFRAWVENEEAMDITREWLKLAYAGKGDAQLVETIMPLLHIIDRLPLTIESLKTSKLGKIIVRLVKEPPAPAIKDMASNLERKWRQLLAANNEEASKRMEVDEDTKGKKRKAEASSSKTAPPMKKTVLSTAGPSSGKPVVVKKEAKNVVREVKDAKSDSSFFSAPKPKPKLPSFKKAPPAPVKKEPDPNIAQPSSINPFEEALKSMAKGRRDSPATATPPPAHPSFAPVASTSTVTSGKQKKTVTWAPEGKLEMIKLIERAVYDDDPADGILSTHNVRDLDRDEGAALHAHLFEEQIEWSEPLLIDIPPDIEIRTRGEDSLEKLTQEEREQSALVALYMSAATIPDSPAEPPSQISEEQVDEGVRRMLTGPNVDSIFWSGDAPAAIEPPKASVADLVGQLAAGSADVLMSNTSSGAHHFDFKAYDLDSTVMQGLPGLTTLSPEQLQQLVQHAQALTQGGMFPQGSSAGQPAPGGDQSWGSGQFSDYERAGYYEEGGRDRRWSEDGWSERGSSRGRGFRSRGRGRGDGFRSNKRKPCSFFAAGRCRYGDQCDFSHEPISY